MDLIRPENKTVYVGYPGGGSIFPVTVWHTPSLGGGPPWRSIVA